VGEVLDGERGEVENHGIGRGGGGALGWGVVGEGLEGALDGVVEGEEGGAVGVGEDFLAIGEVVGAEADEEALGLESCAGAKAVGDGLSAVCLAKAVVALEDARGVEGEAGWGWRRHNNSPEGVAHTISTSDNSPTLAREIRPV
jgi:hypothetical protein